MGKLYNVLAVFSVGSMLALVGFGVFLVMSERLTPARAELLAAVLRGELDDWDRGQPTSQPVASTSQPASGVRGQSAEEVRAARRQDHLRHQMLERALRDVEARQRLLDHCLLYTSPSPRDS